MSEKTMKFIEYYPLKSAYNPRVVPTKNTFTFISRLNGMPQVWTMNQENEPELLSEIEGNILSHFHSPTGEQTIVGVDYNGNERQQIYLINNEEQQMEPLVDAPEYFHYIGGWSKDGKKITFSSNRRNLGYFDVYVFDITTKKMTEVFQFDGNCIPLQWIDEENVLVSIEETNFDKSLYILHLKTEKLTKIGKENICRYASIQITNDCKSGYVLTDSDADTLTLNWFSLDAPDKLVKLVHWEKWDVEEFALSANEELIVLTVNENARSKLYLYDVASKELTEIPDVAHGVISSISWLNQTEFIFALNTPKLPGDIWKYSVSSKQLERQTFLGESVELKDAWIESEHYTFPSFDNLEIPYFTYEKGTLKNKPALIYVHGGPESQYKTDALPLIQSLASQGYLVVAPNIRGSLGYGRKYTELDDVEKRLEPVRDLVCLAGHLVQMHQVDIKNIFIMGHSYGGLMTLAAITHFPDIWAGAVDFVGISDFTTFLTNTGAWRRRIRESEYGTIANNANFFKEFSPLNHSNQIKVPLLVFHGENDTRVPISESEQLVTSMKSRGQEVEYVTFDNEGHFIEKLDNQTAMDLRIIEFLNGNIK